MVSSHAIHYRNEKTLREMLRIDPRERERRAGRRSSCSAKTRRSMRSAAATCRRRSARTRSTSTWAARCRRCARRARARRCWRDPRPRGRARARGCRGRRRRRRAAGDGQAALGPARAARRSGFELAHRLVAEAGVAAIAFHPRSAAVQHKGMPDYELARAARRVAAGAGDPDRRPERRRRRARGVRADGRRGRDARARRARQPVAVRRARRGTRARRRAARRCSRSSTGRSIAPSSTSARTRAARYLRKFYPWYVERLELDAHGRASAAGGPAAVAQTLAERPGAARARLRRAARAGRLKPVLRGRLLRPAILLRSLRAVAPRASPLAGGVLCVVGRNLQPRSRVTCRRTSSSPLKA